MQAYIDALDYCADEKSDRAANVRVELVRALADLNAQLSDTVSAAIPAARHADRSCS